MNVRNIKKKIGKKDYFCVDFRYFKAIYTQIRLIIKTEKDTKRNNKKNIKRWKSFHLAKMLYGHTKINRTLVA